MPTAPLRYAESIPFLLSQTGAAVARMFANELAEVGITPRAFGVLSSLVLHGSQTQQQLADGLGMHRNNMVGLIDEMESAGWVRRQRSSADRRAFEIRLTAAGSSIVRRADRVVPELERALTAGLNAAERAALRGSLLRIASDLGLVAGVHPHLAAR